MKRIFAVLACIGLPMHAMAAEPLPGPVPAETVRVVDGDTVAVRAHIWPGHYVETRVRLAGVDTPEARGPDCEAERALAAHASQFTRDWLEGASISLEEIDLGSFAGRVVARIRRADGADLSEDLLRAGLATPYGDPAPWCLLPAQTGPVSQAGPASR
jgi:endonuclease YncB( thermonuclease family)